MEAPGRQAAPDQDQEVVLEGLPPLPRGLLSPRHAPEVTRSWPAKDRAPPPEPVAWPLVTPTAVFVAIALAAALVPGALQEPLVLSIRPIEPVVGVMGAMFAWFLYNTIREEARLNARGETLFLEKRLDRRRALARTDRVLRGATEELVAGYPVPKVLARLEERTRRGDAMPPGRARRCYDVAAGIMLVGDGKEAARRIEGAVLVMEGRPLRALHVNLRDPFRRGTASTHACPVPPS